REGCGGFLCPPGHPMHTFSVYEGPRGNPRSITSLESAADASWLSDKVRTEAKALLDAYDTTKPALESPEVQEWLYQLLGYFRGCYRNPNAEAAKQWHASDLIIDKRDPMTTP